VIGIANAKEPPGGNPAEGGVLLVENGALMYRGSEGTVTVIAPLEDVTFINADRWDVHVAGPRRQQRPQRSGNANQANAFPEGRAESQSRSHHPAAGGFAELP
jgi:hypothetical protein